jgi:cytochrome c biogenesis protein CcmG/thiol:disulfide interchange protein DsbE
VIARIGVRKDGAEVGALRPMMNQYRTQRESIGTPAVRTGLVEDLYLSAMNIDEETGTVGLLVLINPLVSWLWIATVIMAIGGLMALVSSARAGQASRPPGNFKPSPSAERLEPSKGPEAMNKGVLAIGLAVTTPLIALLLLNLGRDPTSIRTPLIEKPAPDVRLLELSGGGSLQLSSLRGRPVVVNFWATWCIPCIQEHAALTAAARQPRRGLLGVVYEDNAENAGDFRAAETRISYADDDGKATIAFGVYGVPETYFIDSLGTIVDAVGPPDPDTIRRNRRYLKMKSGPIDDCEGGLWPASFCPCGSGAAQEPCPSLSTETTSILGPPGRGRLDTDVIAVLESPLALPPNRR